MLKRIFFSLSLVLAFLPCLGTAGNVLQPFEPASLQRIVEQHKGKPFVLIVWSLDCTYCQTSMEHLVQAKRDNKALTIVTLATDSAADAQAAEMIRKRLIKLQLADNAWAFGSAARDKLNYALDPKWHGEKPRSYWFSAQGERVAYSGVLDPSVIKKLYRQVTK